MTARPHPREARHPSSGCLLLGPATLGKPGTLPRVASFSVPPPSGSETPFLGLPPFRSHRTEASFGSIVRQVRAWGQPSMPSARQDKEQLTNHDTPARQVREQLTYHGTSVPGQGADCAFRTKSMARSTRRLDLGARSSAYKCPQGPGMRGGWKSLPHGFHLIPRSDLSIGEVTPQARGLLGFLCCAGFDLGESPSEDTIVKVVVAEDNAPRSASPFHPEAVDPAAPRCPVGARTSFALSEEVKVGRTILDLITDIQSF